MRRFRDQCHAMKPAKFEVKAEDWGVVGGKDDADKKAGSTPWYNE
jgi:hypothetical protein